jgi:AcrR family transcriptional regulator
VTADVRISEDDDLEQRLRAVRRPRPVLDRKRELALTARQREILDHLSVIFNDGFADLAVAELASRLNCSLRTLYLLAPSRDELVLTVVDRHLWRVGREARQAIKPGMAPLEAARAYLEATTLALSGWTAPFARDLNEVNAAQHLRDEHDEYLFAVTRTLLDMAVERGDIVDVDTAAVARVLAGLGRFFTRPEVLTSLRSSPQEAAKELVDIVFLGLQAESDFNRASARPGDPASAATSASSARRRRPRTRSR